MTKLNVLISVILTLSACAQNIKNVAVPVHSPVLLFDYRIDTKQDAYEAWNDCLLMYANNSDKRHEC